MRSAMLGNDLKVKAEETRSLHENCHKKSVLFGNASPVKLKSLYLNLVKKLYNVEYCLNVELACEIQGTYKTFCIPGK